MINWELKHRYWVTDACVFPLPPDGNIDEVEAERLLDKAYKNGCTGCGYCMPCPMGVNIPGSFRCWNLYNMYQSFDAVSWTWNNEMGDAHQPKNCTECGKCEAACPQHLPIREQLKLVQEELGTNENN